jgi:hypothetical protein
MSAGGNCQLTSIRPPWATSFSVCDWMDRPRRHLHAKGSAGWIEARGSFAVSAGDTGRVGSALVALGQPSRLRCVNRLALALRSGHLRLAVKLVLAGIERP